MVPKLIFSTVGTSSVTNKNKEAKRINELSNKTGIDLSVEEREFLDRQIEERKQMMLDYVNNNNINDLKELSAELNGIISYYGDNLNSNNLNDNHILLSTDTYIGNKTAELIGEILRKLGFEETYVIDIEKLNTKNTDNFREGLINLRKTINNYKDKEYRKIFNLTGGFKSVNAFLNILGMFYADEIIYIFETKTDLIKIPKLPLKIDFDSLRNNYLEFLLLHPDVNVNGIEREFIQNINDIFLFPVDNKYILNEWGEFIWEEILKNLILEKGLPDFANLEYDGSIKRQYENLEKTDKIKLVLKISRAFYLLRNGNINDLRNDNILQLNNDTNDYSDYKFNFKDNLRVFCNYKENMLTLKVIKKHEGNNYIDI